MTRAERVRQNRRDRIRIYYTAGSFYSSPIALSNGIVRRSANTFHAEDLSSNNNSGEYALVRAEEQGRSWRSAQGSRHHAVVDAAEATRLREAFRRLHSCAQRVERVQSHVNRRAGASATDERQREGNLVSIRALVRHDEQVTTACASVLDRSLEGG